MTEAGRKAVKSGKQRRAEIKAARLRKAEKLYPSFDTTKPPIPKQGVKADQSRMVTVGIPEFFDFPLYYLDKPFKCKKCGATEVWTAKQQKWWYEIAQGAMETTAVHCRACRRQIRADKVEQKEHMQKMADRAPHPNEAFFRKN